MRNVKIQPPLRPNPTQTPATSPGVGIKAYFSAGGGYWDFEASNMNDASGNGNNMTEVATPTYGTPGKPGTYVNLASASSQYGNLADNASISMGAGVSFTCGGWFNLQSAGAVREIMAKGDIASAASCCYSINYSNSSSRMRFTCSDGSLVTSVFDPTAI